MALSLMLIPSEYADVKAGVAHARASVPLQIKGYLHPPMMAATAKMMTATVMMVMMMIVRGRYCFQANLVWPAS